MPDRRDHRVVGSSSSRPDPTTSRSRTGAWSGHQSDAQLQASGEKGGEIERIYRLDALAYVAESKDGTLVGRVGQLPGLVAGLPHDLQRSAVGVSTLEATPTKEGKTDDQAEGVEHQVKRTEDRDPRT